MTENIKTQLILNEEDQAHILKWLKEKWPESRHICELCAEQKWLIHPHIVSPITLDSGNMILGGSLYPVIQVMCITCGNTKYLNAMVVKVPSLQKEQAKSNA